MSKTKYNILLADDHQLILDGLVKIVSELELVDKITTVNNGLEALRLPGLNNTDLLLTDIEMPEMNGIELLKKIKQHHPRMKVIMLTMHNNAGLVKEIIKLEADGYLLKSANEAELQQAVTTVLQGKKYFSQDVTLQLATSLSADRADSKQLELLTAREREILPLIAQGFSNKEIAEKLFLSAKTIDSHRTNLMAKLDIHNVAGITRFAIRHNLI